MEKNFTQPSGQRDTDDANLLFALDASIKDKNTLTTHEFSKFAPLFNKENAILKPIHECDGEELKRIDVLRGLSTEYHQRVSPYHDVVIVDDKKEVVTTIPPAFHKFKSLTDHMSAADAGTITDALMNSIARDSPISTRVSDIADLMQRYIQSGVDVDELKLAQADFEKKAGVIESGGQDSPTETKEVGQDDVNDALDGAQWS